MPHRLSTAMTRMSGRRGLAYLLTLAAAIGGVTAIVLAVMAQQSAPTPPLTGAGTISSSPSIPATPDGRATHVPTRGEATITPATQQPVEPALARSVPTMIEIPAIGVRSAVIPIGRTASGDLAVPQPGPNLDKAAWYKNSVTPGQVGPSVIEGHVDSAFGPSVFFKLGALRPGDKIVVTRADQSVARFVVNGIRSYATHADFPRATVFGGDISEPTLRLITCSNFDDAIGHYLGNTVVFAHLSAIQS